MLAPWTGAYGGQLPFDKVQVSAFRPAIEEAMRQELAEIDAITANPQPPTFENTLVALEHSGQAFNRIMTLYGVWTGKPKPSRRAGDGAGNVAQDRRLQRPN